MSKPYSKESSTISAKTYREEYLSQTKKKNKYGAKKQDYNGKKYDSNLECRYAQELDFRIDAGEVKKWDRQVKIDLTVNGVHITFYYCDFRVELTDGTIQYVETKGVKTAAFVLKWKLLLALKDDLLEPGAELLIVK